MTTTSNLLGSITHDQAVVENFVGTDVRATFGITEVAFSDDAGGDLTNLTYLQTNAVRWSAIARAVESATVRLNKGRHERRRSL